MFYLIGYRVAWNRLKTWADFDNIEDRVGYQTIIYRITFVINPYLMSIGQIWS